MKTKAFITFRGQFFFWKIGLERSLEALFIAKGRNKNFFQGIFTQYLRKKNEKTSTDDDDGVENKHS
jgi:hypothetical protein